MLSVLVLATVAAMVAVPYIFRTEAVAQDAKGAKNSSGPNENLPNYDIRTSKEGAEDLVKFRLAAGKNAESVASEVEGFVRGEESLRSRVKGLKVEYNSDIRTPEVIGVDVKMGREFLTSPASGKRSDVLRNFIKQNNYLVGVNDSQTDLLKTTADYPNPDGRLSFVRLEQVIDDVPVFRGEVKAGITKSGELIRVINNLAPGLDYGSLSTDFGDPLAAVRTAAENIKYELTFPEDSLNAAASTDSKSVFGSGEWATTAEKMYFPTEPGVARPAWRVLIWLPVNAYYVIVDAETGVVLWRKNITEDQTQTATYQVYNNPNAFIPAADSPAPLSPGPIDPTTGTQGAIIARTNVTLIGNEGLNSFNNNGWITDGNNTTDGNAVEAGVDRVSPNGVDATQTGDPVRVFESTWNPPPGNPAPGDEPLTPQAQRGAVVQMFYVVNRYHDILYRLGFNEQAGNFQNLNFGRGGSEGDRISAEGQDSSDTDNANFATPADGGRGRMQMFLWEGPTPDHDGTADAEIVIHEITHGTASRLHGNASGLTSNMARSMGEGWGDFFGNALLAEPTDPINGVYTTAGYSTKLIGSGFLGNYYYGIRRFPRAPITLLGANGKPHNPFTFRYANNDCSSLVGTSTTNPSSAFPRGPVGSSVCDQVHNLGEIWSSALWEVRNRFVQRLGFQTGTMKVLQFVTDGMKLAPLSPTFIQERDAIIAAAQASSLAPEAAADVTDVWNGFRARGLGFSAVITNAGTGTNDTSVVENFDPPNAALVDPFVVSDASGDGDGVPEPGETVTFTINIANSTGNTVNNVRANVNGASNVSYGNILNGQTVARNHTYVIPPGAACGSLHTVTINVLSDLGVNVPQQKSLILGTPSIGLSENFDGVTAPSLPAGWTTTLSNPPAPNAGVPWVTSLVNPRSAPNAAFADESEFVGLTELESPAIAVGSATAQLKFDLNVFAEANGDTGFDGLVLEIKIGGGTYQDIEAAGGTFGEFGYTHTMSSGFGNPLPGRRAWSGNSAGYRSVVVNLPASANGQSIRLKWRFGTDESIAEDGVKIDNVTIINSYTCSGGGPIGKSVRADFDGDLKSDLSIFRPIEGNWYLNRSTAGFTGLKWGIGSDTLVPGDYDGDKKTDTAIFRPSNTPGVADFLILFSNNFTFTGIDWGINGDVPTIRDYDGDQKDDVAIWRPTSGHWYIIRSADQGVIIEQFGQAGDVPTPGDYNGDGKTNLAVFRPGSNTWFIANTIVNANQNFYGVPFGSAGDKLVWADYDGDGSDDIATFRPATGVWYILRSASNALLVYQFGINGDIPTPGDYDGDGKYEPAIYRSGVWHLLRSTAGYTASQFGVGSDIPIPGEYLP